jgi:CIC family chloride channel protein
VLAREAERSLQGDGAGATVGEVARQLPTLRTDANLEDALGVLVATDAAGLPVVDPARDAVVGWLTHGDVLRLYHERSAARAAARRRR